MKVLKVLAGFGGLILFSVVVLGGLLDALGLLGAILAWAILIVVAFDVYP